MRVLLQKVKKASVVVDGNTVGSIDKGYCLLVGISKYSKEEDAKYLANKIVNARLFEDENGKLNLDLKEVKGSILSISQFTLYADTKKGKRPSFTDAADLKYANKLYNIFNNYLKNYNINVQTGIFQTHMEVNIVNDGPVTILYEKISNR